MKKLLLLMSLALLFSCGNSETSHGHIESTEEHKGPSSYYDPQAVDLTKDNIEINNLSEDFYNPNKWEGMDNDHYSVPVIQEDNSLKFNNTNAAYNLGDYSNKTISFNVKGNNDWNIYLLANDKSNNSNHIRLECQYNVLRIKTSFSGVHAVAYVPFGYNFKMNEFNRLDLKFTTENNKTSMKMWLDSVPVTLKQATDFTSSGVEITNGELVLKQSDSFTLGNYFVVKVWDDEDYIYLSKVI